MGLLRRLAPWLGFLLIACDDGSTGGGPVDGAPDRTEDARADDDASEDAGDVRPSGDHLTAAHCGDEAAHAAGTFLYVGGGGTEGRVTSSVDGLEWRDETTTSRGAMFEGHTRNLVRGAGYGGGVFVLVGGNDNAYVVTTCDGARFRHDVLGTNVEAPPPPEYDNFLSDVAYQDGVFVAAGGGGKRISSFDHGLTWEETGRFVAGHFREIEGGNGRFVATGASFDLTRALTSASEDGRTWSEPLLAGEPLDRGLAFGNGIFVAVGETRCAVSVDGKRWDACGVDAEAPRFVDVQFVGERFLLQTADGVLASEHGRDFTDSGRDSIPSNLVDGPDRIVFASGGRRGAGTSLDDLDARAFPPLRALTGGEVLYEP